MPQISLYIDASTLKKVEQAALRRHVSISRWVAEQLREKLAPEYPAGYGELFGAYAKHPLHRPEQPSVSADVERESL